MKKQCANTLLMVRPANFGYNPETADNNVFQSNNDSRSIEEIAAMAMKEFDELLSRLEAASIEVVVIEDSVQPKKTDAVFPNNWFTTHDDGRIILYPMYSPNRRLERRTDIIDYLQETYEVSEVKSYTAHEDKGVILEGTGSMIIDRPNEIIYACLSQRTDQRLLDDLAAELGGYEVMGFVAVDDQGVPYYHTNVIMTLGDDLAIICLESIADPNERARVEEKLKSTGKVIVDISRSQVLKYCGNMLQVNNTKGEQYMVMSQSARDHLTPSQISQIESYVTILSSPIDIIEEYGGGSARCMLAELFLAPKSP